MSTRKRTHYNSDTIFQEVFDVDAEALRTSVQNSGLNTPSIQNVPMLLANTEYAIELPEHTASLIVKIRQPKGKVFISWSQNSSTYLTLNAGTVYSESMLDLVSSKTLYVKTTVPETILEVLSWVKQ